MDKSKLTQSEIRNMSLECDKVGGINLSQGISNLGLHPFIKEGAFNAINQGYNYYTRFDGVDELRRAIAKKSNSYNEIKCNSEKNIIVSSGATGALYSSLLGLLNRGDEIIIFEPFYGYHLNTIYALGLVPIFVSLELPSLEINFEQLFKSITNKTKAILICTPSNPSGKIFTKQELLKIGEIVNEKNLFLFSDEIYEYFLYDDLKHISPASLTSLKDRTITISGFSKTFSITGWRIGYCIVPEQFYEIIGHINDLIYVCGPSPLQFGVANGLDNLTEDFYNNIKKSFTKKRNLVCGILKDIGLDPIIPQGAYYILANVSKIDGLTSKEKAMNILQKTKVASVPGSAFYNNNGGENMVRFCFAKEDYELENACTNLLKLK